LYISSVSGDTVSFTSVSPVDRYRGALKGILPDDAVALQRNARRDRDTAKL